MNQFRAEPLSDDDLADRFATRHCGKWRYCHTLRRWFKWDGAVWQQDRVREIEHLASLLSIEAIHWPEAANLTPSMKRRINSTRTIRGILRFAMCDPRMAATPEELGFATPKPWAAGKRWKSTRLTP